MYEGYTNFFMHISTFLNNQINNSNILIRKFLENNNEKFYVSH